MKPKKISLFAAFGIEIEYMIVNRETLDIAAISDQLIHDVIGDYRNEVEFEEIAWSNELVLHVIELKTNGPAKELQGLAKFFQKNVRRINQLLEPYNAILLPTGAHPWMNPDHGVKLWPHHDNIIYETYDKIFDCKGHGWSNLQSTHLNLPFASDVEFAKLHSAIRLLLPIIPALSASSPVIEGKLTGYMDTRLEYYRNNQIKIPSVTGFVIPEVVLSKKEYENNILQKMFDEISSFDPDNILQEEWLNSRGAIARFERNAIEIRILDTQECPAADIAISAFVVAILQALITEKWLKFSEQLTFKEEELLQIFLSVIRDGMNASIEDKNYLKLFSYPESKATAGDLWRHLYQEVKENKNISPHLAQIEHILAKGNLAERILQALNNSTKSDKLRLVYQQLSECLESGEMFTAI